MALHYSNSTNFTNNYDSGSSLESGSGSGSGSGSESQYIEQDDNIIIEYNNRLSIGILLALSPLIVAGGALILCFIYMNIYIPIKDYIKSLKYSYNSKQEEKKLPIYNNKLNPIFIKELNKNNIDKVKNKKESLECSICLTEINIENYKNKKTDLVFLNCSHVYHKKCLNEWVKAKVQSFNHPDCPLCRDKIISINDIKINIASESDSSGYDSDDYYS